MGDENAAIHHKHPTGAIRGAARMSRGAATLLGLLGLALLAFRPLAPLDCQGAALDDTATPQLLLVEQVPDATRAASGTTSGWVHQLRPIDPLHLTNLPGYTPIPLGDRYISARGPDGRTLAVFTAAWGFPSVAQSPIWTLHLIDLADWRDTATATTFTGEIVWLGFTPDGRALRWLSDESPSDSPLHRYTLHGHDLRTGATRLMGRLTLGKLANLEPGLRLARAGDTLIFCGGAVTTAGTVSAQLWLHFLDLGSGGSIEALPLIGVAATAPPDARGDGTTDLLAPGYAWDVAHDRLYIAHADTNLLTVVDLATRRIVRQEAIGGSPPSVADVQPTYTTSRISIPGTARYRFIAASSDGKSLFVGGRETVATPLPGDRWEIRDRAEATRVIDAATFRTTGQLPDRSALLAATPRGILIWNGRYLSNGRPSLEPGDFRLRLLEPGSLRELWSQDVAPGDVWPMTVAPDGHHLYLFRPIYGGFARRDGPDLLNNDKAIGVFDFVTQQLIAERVSPYGDALIPLWRH